MQNKNILLRKLLSAYLDNIFEIYFVQNIKCDYGVAICISIQYQNQTNYVLKIMFLSIVMFFILKRDNKCLFKHHFSI